MKVDRKRGGDAEPNGVPAPPPFEQSYCGRAEMKARDQFAMCRSDRPQSRDAQVFHRFHEAGRFERTPEPGALITSDIQTVEIPWRPEPTLWK